jgi:hypothetical protein
MIWSGRMVCDGSLPNPWRRIEEPDPQAITMDNREVPLRAQPWRHDVDNWLDFESRDGFFLQVPINSMPFLDRSRVETAIQGSGEVAFIVLDTHPYDIQSSGSGGIAEQAVEKYREDLIWVHDRYNCEFIRIDNVLEKWSGYSQE